LQNSPELLNADPHGEAWLIRVHLAHRSDIESLMSSEEYEAYILEKKGE
jgi:glycine cleavage system H protein